MNEKNNCEYLLLNEWMNDWMNEWMNWWMIKTENEWVDKWRMNEWIRKSEYIHSFADIQIW